MRAVQEQRIAAQEKKLGRPLTKAERRQFALTPEEREQLREQARFSVASDVVAAGRPSGSASRWR